MSCAQICFPVVLSSANNWLRELVAKSRLPTMSGVECGPRPSLKSIPAVPLPQAASPQAIARPDGTAYTAGRFPRVWTNVPRQADGSTASSAPRRARSAPGRSSRTRSCARGRPTAATHVLRAQRRRQPGIDRPWLRTLRSARVPPQPPTVVFQSPFPNQHSTTNQRSQINNPQWFNPVSTIPTDRCVRPVVPGRAPRRA
jgi:hypothetical protein